jgi:hypothetical protein
MATATPAGTGLGLLSDDTDTSLVPSLVRPTTSASSSAGGGSGLFGGSGNDDDEQVTSSPVAKPTGAVGAGGTGGTSSSGLHSGSANSGSNTNSNANVNANASTAENVQDAWSGCKTYGWTSAQCENKLAVIIVPIVVCECI